MPIVLHYVPVTAFFRRPFGLDPGRFLEARGDRVKGIIRVNGDAFALPIRKRKAIGELIAAIFRQILIKRCPSEGP